MVFIVLIDCAFPSLLEHRFLSDIAYRKIYASIQSIRHGLRVIHWSLDISLANFVAIANAFLLYGNNNVSRTMARFLSADP
jgi:hypothetical protein